MEGRDYKRSISWLRAAARSGRWPRSLACAIPFCGDGWSNEGPGAARPTTQATLPSADHAAEIARLQRENERLRMERDILKNCPAPWRACAA
jgi:transposase-like protein